MATIKDIAKLAGVSHGTVSNVLNGCGNVSSAKIIAVQRAAEQLGYVMNSRAKDLRLSASRTLALVLPNRSDRKYIDLHKSFSHYAEEAGYTVSLFISGGSVKQEERSISVIRSLNPAGIAVMTACGTRNLYENSGFAPEQILYLNHCMDPRSSSIGFDYHQIGRELGEVACQYKNVALITSDPKLERVNDLLQAFFKRTQNSGCSVQHYNRNDYLRDSAMGFEMFSAQPAPEAVFTTSMNTAQSMRNMQRAFFGDRKVDFYTLASLYILPENDFHKYELNFRRFGKEAAQMLIDSLQGKCKKPEHRLLENDGFRNWKPRRVSDAECITMMTLDSPAAHIVEQMAGMYTQETGVKVKVAIFSYDSLHDTLSTPQELAHYDMIRMDVNWLPYYARRIYAPLREIDPDIDAQLKTFLPNIMDKYGLLDDELYALPETPSAQMLFYRKDLLENPVYQRIYKEQNRAVLAPPRTFDEYNRIARFFTRRFNPASPTTYGSTLTLGNRSVIATEFLARYYALRTHLFDKENGSLQLVSPEGVQALEQLIEVKQYAAPGHSNWWRNTARQFSQGDVAMTVLFSNYASELLEAASCIREDIGYAISPGNNSLYGGGAIGVSRGSAHKKEALNFIRWLLSPEVSTAMALLGSVSPCRATCDNYHVIDAYPWLSLSEKCFERSEIQRLPPQIAGEFSDRSLTNILGTYVSGALSGSLTVEEALSQAQKRVESEIKRNA